MKCNRDDDDDDEDERSASIADSTASKIYFSCLQSKPLLADRQKWRSKERISLLFLLLLSPISIITTQWQKYKIITQKKFSKLHIYIYIYMHTQRQRQREEST